MSLSDKNRLLEFCQKEKIQMPIYNTWSTGPPHQLLWFANIILKIDNTDIILETKEPSKNKTSAEINVSSMMMNYINVNVNVDVNVDVNVGGYKIDNIYLIDLENRPAFKHKTESNSLYIGFINEMHHSIDKYSGWHKCKSDDISKEICESNSRKIFYAINGGTQDLADHLMTLILYPVVWYIQTLDYYPNIIIVSGDHAGWCTRICLEKILSWKNIPNIPNILIKVARTM
ncbi:MAG: double-stranded RNA binding motif protein [Satyrvirus sp.]|uniref:Double-stranded RNA binding motif protein n=1 Tax=Satyrvirus sp. TaxID=2487771 RepID=A0A3G5AHA1_9VIRU|nr:MAG: double-stranded RNA binding motif protein [Satyrvirus sp.]